MKPLVTRTLQDVERRYITSVKPRNAITYANNFHLDLKLMQKHLMFNMRWNKFLPHVIPRLVALSVLLGGVLWAAMLVVMCEYPSQHGTLFISAVLSSDHSAFYGVFDATDYRLSQALVVFSSLESAVFNSLVNGWYGSLIVLIFGVSSRLLYKVNRLRVIGLMLLLSGGFVVLPASLTLASLFLFASYLILLARVGYLVDPIFGVDSPSQSKSSLIAYASQSGTAQALAHQIAQSSYQYCDIKAFAELTPNCLQQYQQLFVVAATYGDGQAPEKSNHFVQALTQCHHGLHNLNFAVLALGDRAYPKFCAFGHQISTLLQEKGARALCPVQEIDNGDIAPVTQWWQRLCHDLGWSVKRVDKDWHSATVVANQCLNASQPSRLAHLLSLELPKAKYQAGDLLEVLTPVKPDVIASKLLAQGLDGANHVQFDGQSIALNEALTVLEWQQQTALTPQALVDQLPMLRPRVYSIASGPNDPKISLLVRRLVKDDGGLGFSSSQLCASDLGRHFQVSLRSHDSFRLPRTNVPLILICAGTGIAPFMSFLAQRRQWGFDAPIWLIAGEQYQDNGCYFKSQLECYIRDSIVTQLSYAFSRDEAWLSDLKPRYVDDILLAKRGHVLHQVNHANAEIFVCGNARGMGNSVKTALADIFESGYQTLVEETRLHFDLY